MEVMGKPAAVGGAGKNNGNVGGGVDKVRGACGSNGEAGGSDGLSWGAGG